MDTFTPGSTAYTEMIFLDEDDQPVEVTNPRVDRIFVGPPEETLTTDAVPVHDGGGHYTYSAVLAADADLGLYRDYWTADGGYEASEFFEVAADPEPGVYFTEAEARAFRSGKLANETKYPDADIEAAREEIEEFIEKIVGYACVPRTKTVTINGDGTAELFLPDTRVTAVSAITDTDGPFDSVALADVVLTEYGSIRRRSLGYFTAGWGNVSVTYTHGLPECPGPIKRAALILLYNRLVGSDVSDRAQSFTNESGTLAYSTPNGMARPTGLPEVDAILYKYSDHRVGVA